uniref:Putative secreted protein n=1 Tax=Anopheles triannulatus TaxID=58253 RepID=A0A2M4B6E7_9DIPT
MPWRVWRVWFFFSFCQWVTNTRFCCRVGRTLVLLPRLRHTQSQQTESSATNEEKKIRKKRYNRTER